MIEIKKILFPTDFSECAERAQRYAVEFAKMFGAKLYLLHVLDSRIYSHLESIIDAGRLLADARESAGRSLEETIAPEERDGLEVEHLVRQGTPFLEIVRFAEDEKIDLIVIGTHGRTGLRHMLMGSCGERVVRRAPCPVLAVRPEAGYLLMT